MKKNILIVEDHELTRFGLKTAFDGVDFVVMCLDDPLAKGPIIRHLQDKGIPFVDTGMDIQRKDALFGVVRTTFCSADAEGQRTAQKYINMIGLAHADEYDANIQIAELNSLNAAMAVIRWKRHYGFYSPSNRQRGVSYVNMVYSLSGDILHHEKDSQESV